jgi:putative oxidoreductase
MQGWLDLAGMHLVLAYFVLTGAFNLTKARIADHVERMAAFGVPFPRAAFWLGIALQFASCALVYSGWHPALGVAGLIVFTITASAIFHRFWQKSDPLQRNISRINLLGNVGLLGGLLLLLARLS